MMGKNQNLKRKPLKPREKIVFEKSEYAVVEFIDDRSKLFEGIPELWFVNEERTACYWPPKKGRSFKLRAIDQDTPDWDWDIYECIVVSEGHATYSIASSIVREKCSQRYNTSSADDHLELAKYRREHPGLIQKGEKSFENLFQKAKFATIKEQQQKSTVDCEKIISLDSSSDMHNNSKDDFNTNIDLNGNVEQHLQNSVPYDSGNQYSNSMESRLEINKRQSGSRQQSSPHSIHSSRLSHSSQRNRSRSSQRIRSERSSRCSSRHSTRHSSKQPNNRSRSGSSQRNRSGRSSRGSSRHSTRHSSKQPNNRSRSGSNQRIRSERSSRCSSPHSSRRSSKATNNRSRSRSSQRNRSERSSRCSSRHSSRRSSKATNNRSRSRSSQRNRSERSSRCSSRHSSRRSSKATNNQNRSRSESKRSSRHSTRGLSHPSSRRSRHRTQYNGNSRSRDLNRQRNRYAFNQRSRTPLSYISVNPGTSKKAVNTRLSRGRGERSKKKSSELTSSVRQPSNSNVDQQQNYTHHQSKQCNSSFRSTRDRPTTTAPQFQGQQNNHLKTLMNNVNQLTKIIMKNEHRNKQNDRCISRMEVTVNKSFVLIGDLVNAFDMRMSLGHFSREVPIPRGYEKPELPIERQGDLRNLNHDLKNKDFLLFLINDQKQYCTPSQQSTDNVVMTGFLKKFISVNIRAKVVLKDLKGQDGLTLCADFPRVYDFIIQVFKAGYEIRNKVLTNKEVHSVLRVVWGRSKQMLNEGNQRLRN